jgi:hypothetical protein
MMEGNVHPALLVGGERVSARASRIDGEVKEKRASRDGVDDSIEHATLGAGAR